MINLSFSFSDLEFFLLVFVRVSCFVFVAPFFSMSNTPRQIRIVLSVFIAMLLYGALAPANVAMYETEIQYAIIVLKEAVTGLLLGFSVSICMSIVGFAGFIVDMETGLSMVTMLDPTTKENTSITGVYYQYMVMLMLIVTGLYRYLLQALADSFQIMPVNGAVFHIDILLEAIIKFLADYIIIGFRICLPIFCAALLLNVVLGVLAKVASQLNMFAVGIQIKIVVGLIVLFLTVVMLPDAVNFIFMEMKDMINAFAKGMSV